MMAIMMEDFIGVSATHWAHVHGLSGAGFVPSSHHWLRASASWGQAQTADVYVEDFGHAAQVGQSELESGEATMSTGPVG